MVRLLKKGEIPDCYKGYDPQHYLFELYDSQGVYAYVALYFEQKPYCNFHMHVVRFGHNVLKMMKEVDWPIGSEIMRMRGAEIVVATKHGTTKENKSYTKLLKHFGFSSPVNHTISTLNLSKE